MGFPQHPEEIIVKNEFYPKGLTEQRIYEYYMKNKDLILKETDNRNILFFVATDINKFVVLRKKGGEFIKLNINNFNKLITGRTTSIHSNLNQIDNICIIDLDHHDFSKVKKATLDVYEYAVNKIPFISKVQIRYTGKTGFHLKCDLKRKSNIDSIRMLLLKSLNNSPLSDKYDIGFRRSPERPNIDLSSNKRMGSYITLGSLSTIGLKSIIVHPDELLNFDKRSCII